MLELVQFMWICVLGLLAIIAFAWVLNEVFTDMAGTRLIVKRLRESRMSYENYPVKYTTNHGKTVGIVVRENGVLIPVSCDHEVYSTVCELLRLNGNDHEIVIRAKIDSERLQIIHVKGYNIK